MRIIKAILLSLIFVLMLNSVFACGVEPSSDNEVNLREDENHRLAAIEDVALELGMTSEQILNPQESIIPYVSYSIDDSTELRFQTIDDSLHTAVLADLNFPNAKVALYNNDEIIMNIADGKIALAEALAAEREEQERKDAEQERKEAEEKAAEKERKDAEAEQEVKRKLQEAERALGYKVVEEGTAQTDVYGATISGVLQNTTGRTVSYAQVSFVITDSNGNQVETAWSNISNWQAGGKWKYEVKVFQTTEFYYQGPIVEISDW